MNGYSDEVNFYQQQQLQIAFNKAEELSLSNAALQQELKSAHSSIQLKDGQLQSISGEYENIKNAYEKLCKKHSEFEIEFESAQKTLEQETLIRVDFENKIQSLREELEFKSKVHATELFEARKVQTVAVSEESYKAEYDQRLEATIMDLRERHEQDIENFKDECDASYNSRIEELEMQVSASRQSSSSSNDKLMGYSVKIDHLEIAVKSLQSENNSVTTTMKDLESQLEMQKQISAKQISEANKERDDMKETLTSLEKEYQELADIKVRLDAEINVYRKLLEEEESRLKMTPSPMPESGTRVRTKARRKRKRVQMSEEMMQQSTATSTMTTTASSSAAEQSEGQQSSVKRRREDVLHEAAGPDADNRCTVM